MQDSSLSRSSSTEVCSLFVVAYQFMKVPVHRDCSGAHRRVAAGKTCAFAGRIIRRGHKHFSTVCPPLKTMKPDAFFLQKKVVHNNLSHGPTTMISIRPSRYPAPVLALSTPPGLPATKQQSATFELNVQADRQGRHSNTLTHDLP